MNRFEPDFAGAEVRPSPNFGERRGGTGPNAIILHYTGMKTGQAAEDWLRERRSEVSSHYIVHEDGRVVQMVREADRAWHAGAGTWQGRDDVNSFSIGIEIVNPGHDFGYRDFPAPQIEAVVTLCRDIAARHALLPQRVLAHSDVAPGRKIDPGERFPWAYLAAQGVGHYVAPRTVSEGQPLSCGDRGEAVAGMQAALAKYGYGIVVTGNYDARTTVVLEAFQRHFRQSCVDGRADASTLATLQRLLETLPEGSTAPS